MLDTSDRCLRSHAFRWLGAFLIFSCLPKFAGAEAVKLIAPTSGTGYRVKTVLEVTGKLLTQAEGEKVPKKHALKALGQYLYEERVLDSKTGRSLRYYEQAAADYVVGGKANEARLTDEARWILVEPHHPDAIYSSPVGPLTREALELFEIPGASSMVNHLLPGKAVSLNDTWPHSDELMASLLSLDNVTANNVSSKLVAIGDGVVRMTVSGKLIGSVHGVVTDVEVDGKYNYDPERKRVVWVVLGIKENREIGASTPGLKVNARLRMVISDDQPIRFATRKAAERFGALESAGTLLQHNSQDGKYSILHDRRWHVWMERPAMTILRCVEDDRRVAQCNIRVLPPLAEATPLTMAKFQKDIRTALAESMDQIVESQASTSRTGDKVLRVVASGMASEAPIQWVYYHVTHQDGRRISCVFTLSIDDVERFGGEDLALIESLTFAPGDAASTAGRESQRR